MVCVDALRAATSQTFGEDLTRASGFRVLGFIVFRDQVSDRKTRTPNLGPYTTKGCV